jgi:DNA primase|nr:MAG TPA: DNA primase (bacterial type) [Caudoviricetes sp.]
MNNLFKVIWYYGFVSDYTTSEKIVCPFHEDVNPSLLLDFAEEKWFCFGCGRSGDAKDFVKEYEKKYNGLNDLFAYRKYLQILKSSKCSDKKLNLARKKKGRKQDKQLWVEAYDFYHGLKIVDWKKQEDEDIIALMSYMQNRGFDAKALNLVKAKYTYNDSYPLIFPMLDNGKFKGWVCRTTKANIEKKRKYLYNEGFSRATTLVGDYGAKDYVIVVEGYMDRLKFVQFGEENVVAILGWKMSAQQIEKLKSKGIKKVISALDNDNCGRKGTKFLNSHFEVIRWKYLKGLKDPGDMTKESFYKMYKQTLKELSKGERKNEST